MFSKSEKDLRNEIIQKATADPIHRKPSPHKFYVWDDEDFVDFHVQQNGQPVKLHTYRCFPSGDPTSITIFFHGLNEHMGLYAHIAQSISKEANSVVVGLDFRGFGKSQGVRGLVENTQQLIGDCEDFIKLIKVYYCGIHGPVFCLGQSMGGMACYLMGQKAQVDGTILIVPAIMDNTYNSKYGKLFAQLIGGWFPSLRLVPPDNTKHYNKNPQILEDQLNDPYAYNGYLMPGTIKTIVDNMKGLPQSFGNYTCPFLIISAGMDSLVDPDVGEELFKQVRETYKQSPVSDKQWIHKPNMFHNAILEEEIHELIPEIVKWIDERANRKNGQEKK